MVAAEEGMSSLASAFREAKRISESALLPIVDKVASDVKTKAKIAQNAFEVVVMGMMDLVEEVGATMGGLGGVGKSQNVAAKDESEVTSSSSSSSSSSNVPASVESSQSSAEDAAVVGEKEPEGADGDNKEVEKVVEVEKEEKVEKLVEPTTTGGNV